MWNQWADSAKASWSKAVEQSTQALEKTGDALTKAATSHRHSSDDTRTSAAAATLADQGGEHRKAAESGDTSNDNDDGANQNDHQERLKQWEKQLQTGWSSMLESTMAGWKQAQSSLEEQQHKMADRIARAKLDMMRRDPALPLDIAALRDAEVVYVTDRIITMSHPAQASNDDDNAETISGPRKLAAVAHLLEKRHDGRYMVWNLSEVEYDVQLLHEQVLTFSFPGSPSPPLGLLLKLMISMESWLKADNRNVAVVHCLTGKGRTSVVLAAFLCWMHEANFTDMHAALAYIGACKQMSVDDLTIPSQRRYAGYFKNMLDGVKPAPAPLVLQRVLLSEAPRYAVGPPRPASLHSGSGGGGGGTNSNNSSSHGNNSPQHLDPDVLSLGCAPYLQVFARGELLHTAPAKLHFQQDAQELPFCQVADGVIRFDVNIPVTGDILLRCRHISAKRQRVSMFRAALHVGYSPHVLRLTKEQLDGACHDDRFPADFYLDVIFEPATAEQAQQLQDAQQRQQQHSEESFGKVTATADDAMLASGSDFWDVIKQRREAHVAAASLMAAEGDDSKAAMWGPTVGRRRDFAKAKNNRAGHDAAAPVTPGAASAAPTHAQNDNSFSIGGELDFLPETPKVTVTPAAAATVAAVPSPRVRPKDSLMEALMAMDDNDDDEQIEEIVFQESPPPPPPQKQAQPTMVQLPPTPSALAAAEKKPSYAAAAATSSRSDTRLSQDLASQDLSTNDATGPAADSSTATSPPVAVPNQTDAPSRAQEAAATVGNAVDAAADDMDALLDLGNDDMDGLLAGAAGDDDDDALLDLDDDDLADLESFLSPAK